MHKEERHCLRREGVGLTIRRHCRDSPGGDSGGVWMAVRTHACRQGMRVVCQQEEEG